MKSIPYKGYSIKLEQRGHGIDYDIHRGSFCESRGFVLDDSQVASNAAIRRAQELIDCNFETPSVAMIRATPRY